MKTSRSLRGQVWAIDLTTSLAALSIMLLLFILLWNSIAMKVLLTSQDTSMRTSASFASESLMATPGEPESWEMLPQIDDSVSAIGLVNGRNELNRLKLDKLVAENATAYNTVKARLGLQRYEFGMRVTDLSRNTVHYTFGKFSNKTRNNTLKFDRLGILDDEPVVVHMEVWGE